MSDDGADLNITAENGMKAALGGEQPERMEDDAFEAMIRTATVVNSYDGAANVAARRALEYLEANNAARALDADALYERMKADGVDLAALELTGFMWGWAVNAARHILKLHSVPNPAIIEI